MMGGVITGRRRPLNHLKTYASFAFVTPLQGEFWQGEARASRRARAKTAYGYTLLVSELDPAGLSWADLDSPALGGSARDWTIGIGTAGLTWTHLHRADLHLT